MIYDFIYQHPRAPVLGAFIPLRIEGAPDHGTVADARVWADHYDVRIDLSDRTGLRYIVRPGQPARPIRTVWLDSISSRYRDRIVNADPLDVSPGAAATFFERARAAVKAATERVEQWHDHMPIHDSFVIVRGAEGAMADKTAWVGIDPGITAASARKNRAAWLGAVGSHPLMQDYVARKMREEADEARAVRDASLLGLDVASERAQTKADGETFAERMRHRLDKLPRGKLTIDAEAKHHMQDVPPSMLRRELRALEQSRGLPYGRLLTDLWGSK